MRSDLSNKDIDEKYLTRSTDKYLIEHNIYTEISRYYKKTFLSMYEIISFITCIQEYYSCILKASLRLRRYAQDNNLIIQDVIKDIVRKEQEISIAKYKKYRCTLSPSEHMHIINEVINDIKVSCSTLDMNKKNNEHNEVLKVYLKDFRDADKDYFKVLRWL
jgi:hypothetical protein